MINKPVDSPPLFLFEETAYNQGCKSVAGADEAGRGPLAGPVVAAAVILPRPIEGQWCAGIRDSKEMTEAEREACYQLITKHAVAYSVVEVSPQEIDEVNILQASLLGMKRAVESLSIAPDYLLVDGKQYPPVAIPGEAVVKGDQKSLSIGAASILAKVTRDRLMAKLHDEYPHYGWKYHKGYPTKYHRISIRLFGVSPLHRLSFNGSKNFEPIRPVPEFTNQYTSLQSLTTKAEIKEYQESLVFSRLQLGEEEYYYLHQSAKYRCNELIMLEQKTKPTTQKTGYRFEGIAANFLQEKGYRIVTRNYHAAGGEIDIIAETETLLVFVEVKARKSKAHGNPYEAVSKAKMKKIMAATEQYLFGVQPGCDKDIRYDVISIVAPKGKAPEIVHYEDAFRSDDL